jgi:hypothetical protein
MELSMDSVFGPGLEGLDAQAVADRYRNANPFPHIVIDGALAPAVASAACAAFPEVDGPQWTNYLHVNSKKFGNTDMSTWTPELQRVADALMSPEFVRFLEHLTGIDGLHADPTFDGGGLHRSLAGGFLNVHADFTKHHTHDDWRRRINVILYLNEEWDEAWGGHLELWTSDMQTCVDKVAPVGNRMVIFTTSEDSYHGHPDPLTCPDGIARKSMALYYFTAGHSEKARSTDYRSRPGDGARSIAIFLDKKVLRAYDIVKRRLHLSDDTVSRFLGRFRSRSSGGNPTQR